MSKTDWKPDDSVASNSRRVLPALAEKYFDAGRKLVGSNADASTMHRFRLKSKHFRYTLDLFRDVYGPGLEKLLEKLKPVQSALGDLNDCATVLEIVHARHGAVHNYLKQRAEKKTAEFEEYWRTVFDAPGEKDRWVRYLTRGVLVRVSQRKPKSGTKRPRLEQSHDGQQRHQDKGSGSTKIV